MSTIIFEGNTYTFGATVSANPGTGTTSYVLSGLSSGSTYGFIIWAFNGLGPSSIVGPISKVTLSETPEEIRPLIATLDWNAPYYIINPVDIYVDPTPINNTNLFIGSINLTPTAAGGTWWFTSGNVTITPPMGITTGFTAPDGSTTAWQFKSSSNTGWSTARIVYLEKGFTYYLSFYYDHSNGNTGNISYPGMYWDGGSVPSGIVSVPRQQILPVVGSMTTSSQTASPGTSTGWTRYAFQFYTQYDLDTRLNISGLFDIPSGNALGVSNGVRYYWGPQLEKAT